jgi:hypothetical protein
VQRARAQSKTGIFYRYGVAESPPVLQAGWSDRFSFFFISVAMWNIRVSFFTYDGTVP